MSHIEIYQKNFFSLIRLDLCLYPNYTHLHTFYPSSDVWNPSHYLL